MFETTASGMTVSVLVNDGEATVTPKGELDAFSAPVLEGVFLGLRNCGVNAVVLDLTHLSFMDSRGLGSIIAAIRDHPGVSLRAVNPAPQVRGLLDLTGVAPLLSIA